MDRSADLQSQPRVAARSGIGQSHIGRILRSESAATVDVIEALARAFQVSPGDLLVPPESPASNVVPLSVAQPSATVAEITVIAEQLSPEGQWILLGRAQELLARYPLAKPNHAS